MFYDSKWQSHWQPKGNNKCQHRHTIPLPHVVMCAQPNEQTKKKNISAHTNTEPWNEL